MQIGPYTIERELGRGGMGAVYLGRRPGDPLPYAIKVIHADLATDPDLLARFEREGVVLERLSHPNLVALRARGLFSGGLWLAMDYVEGESLEDRLVRSGPLPSPVAGEILTGVSAGLAHAHRSGILHRDLKPANVLLRAVDGQALVADFGLALPLDVSQHLTQTGEVLGSPGYLAPEQCGLGGGSTPATDVYGLGALLYALLTGEAPLRGRSLIETLHFVLTRRPRPPRELVPGVDPGLEAICLRCLAKEPSERYGDAQEVLEALTREPTPPAKGWPLWLLTLAGAVILGAGVFFFARSDVPSSPTATPVQSPATPATPKSADAPSPPLPRAREARTQVREAIEAGRWRAGHEEASRLKGTEASWARYQLLAAELDVTGEESEAWASARERALSAASQEDSAWSRVISALIESLEDLFLGERRSVEDLDRLRLALNQAERVPRVLTPAQEVAILRARAEVAFRLAELRRSKPDWELAKTLHGAWLSGTRVSWRARLLGAFLHAGASQRNLAFQSLRRGELAAARQGHPWARFAFLEVRSRWLRTPGRVRADQAWLSQTVVSANQIAPRSIRVRAALPLSVYFVQDGRSALAVDCLDRHEPSPRANAETRLGWVEAMSQALNRPGGDRARLLKLIGPEVLAQANPRQRDRLRLSRVIALAHLGRAEEARASFAEIPRSTTRPSALLELRASALLGDLERFSSSFAERAETKSRLYRWEELRILDEVGSAARLDTSAARDQLLKALARDPGSFIQALLNAGRWGEALSALERLAENAEDRAQRVLGARLACQILVRAREDEDPGGARFTDAQARCRRFVRRLKAGSPAAVGLGALIEALGDPEERALKQLHQDFALASSELPGWEELHRAHLGLLKKWKRRAGASPDLPGFERRAAEQWLANSRGIAARLASLLQPGPPDLSRLSSLAREAQERRDRAEGVAVQAAVRHRYLSGEIDAKPLITVLRASAAWTGTLRADRRRSLLEAADLLRPPEEHAQEILASLALIEAWCGLPTQTEELARYRRLESEAYVGLGRFQDALAAARPLDALGVDLQDEVRSELQCQLGRAEVLAGVPEGLARIKTALGVHPSPRGYLLSARCSKGADRTRDFERALGFPIPPAWIPSLITEIKAADRSLIALLRVALPSLEARSKDPDCGLGIALALFEGEPKREQALLLWETYGIGSQITIKRARDLPPKLQANLTRAAQLLSAEERTLVAALQAQLVARAELAARVKGRDHAAAIDAATARLASAAGAASEFGDRLRVPLHVHAAFDDLGRLRPGRSRQYMDAGLQLLLTWKQRSAFPLRMPVLLASHYRRRGRFQAAVEVLEEARGGPAKTISGLMGRLNLDLAVNLSDLDREAEALRFCQQALKSSEDYGEEARVRLLEAQIHLRAKRFDEALKAVALASDLCPRIQSEQTLFLRTQVCYGRAMIQSGDLAHAEVMIERLRNLLRGPGLDPLIVGMITGLSAELELTRGRFQVALDTAAQALRVQPASAEAHLVRVAALVGLGKGAAAKAAAGEAARDTRLSPRDQARLQAKADSLP